MKPSISYRAYAFSHLILFILLSFATARDTVTPSRPLADNETLVSSDGAFALGFFTPSNSNNRYVGIWYNTIPTRTIVWVANRASPLVDSSGILSVAANGTLTVTDRTSTVVWSAAGRSGLTSPVARLLDTGNFVVKEDGNDSANYVWQGFDYPTDTLLPGMKLGVDRITGINRTLTAWNRDSDPSPGEFYAAVDINGDPEVYLWSGSTKQWRSGPLGGFSLSPPNHGLVANFVNNSQEVTFSQIVTDQSVVSRLVVNQSGLIQHWLWSREISRWNVSWYAPADKCNNVGQCGAYGICDASESPTICDCLNGFAPSNQQQWDLRNWRRGCVRKMGLDCANATDGFAKVAGVKLPVSANAVVDVNLNFDGCQAKCLRDCNCTAFTSTDVGANGTGCVIWRNELVDTSKIASDGHDLYIRLAASDLASEKGRSLWNRVSWPLAVTAMDAALVAFTIVVTCVVRQLWMRRRKRRRRTTVPCSNNIFMEQWDEDGRGNDLDLPLLDFATVETATDNFSVSNKLGEGGYGPVYKGKLGDGQEIAVKRLSTTSLQGTDEFKNEVILIAKLQNRNLVRLLGCCIEREERMLIYEYMANKSLDAFLFDKQIPPLDWQARYGIILGITRGLLYLHHDSRFRVIHRDLKASNILLDKDMNPKISDFGLARILGGDETNINTKKVVGTYGYMSPEYAMDGIFSLKSDVYSFGVLVLEIVSRKKNRGPCPISPVLNLVAYAWSLWIEGKGMELVDESLNYTVTVHEVLKCIKVALLCVQERPEDRPLMSTVILMLGSDIATLPEPKQPGFIARIFPLEIEAVNRHQTYASNNLTISLVGR